MIIRELKLRPNKKIEEIVNIWMFRLSGVYNWGIRKIEQDSKNSIYYSKIDFQNLLSNHSNKVGISSHTIQGVLVQAWDAWDKCFKKIRKNPNLSP